MATVALLALLGALMTACSPGGVPNGDGAQPEAGARAGETAAVSPLPADPGEERAAAATIRGILPGIDTAVHAVPLREIVSGGVGADSGIPSLHSPALETLDGAAVWLSPREPVIVVEVEGEARIYPIQILMWHEVVNDELGGRAVLVTFCPLCHTAIAFDRTVAGEVRDFGVSGLLRESDLLLYDRQTTTLWQQVTGEAIVGADTGQRLDFLPAQIVAFEDARTQFPDALVLSRRTGHIRAYGTNPYAGYDDIDTDTIFSTSFQDGRLPGKARVLAVELSGQAVAFPFDALAEHLVLHATVAGTPVAAFWHPGTSSALDTRAIPDGRDTGSAGAFVALLDGRPVTFEARDGAIVDAGTGSRWSVFGVAVAGPLAGTRLEPVISGSHFWFVWSVFRPATRVVAE